MRISESAQLCTDVTWRCWCITRSMTWRLSFASPLILLLWFDYISLHISGKRICTLVGITLCVLVPLASVPFTLWALLVSVCNLISALCKLFAMCSRTNGTIRVTLSLPHKKTLLRIIRSLTLADRGTSCCRQYPSFNMPCNTYRTWLSVAIVYSAMCLSSNHLYRAKRSLAIRTPSIPYRVKITRSTICACKQFMSTGVLSVKLCDCHCESCSLIWFLATSFSKLN